MRKLCEDVSRMLHRFSSTDSVLSYSYGRFSKSIRPDECGKWAVGTMPQILAFVSLVLLIVILFLVCGACKQGKLIPLFSDPKKLPKTPKTSRNASIKPKGNCLLTYIGTFIDDLVDDFQTHLVHFLALTWCIKTTLKLRPATLDFMILDITLFTLSMTQIRNLTLASRSLQRLWGLLRYWHRRHLDA